MSFIVYIHVNDNNCVVSVNSNAYLTPSQISSSKWIQIDSGNEEKHYHAQGNYFDKLLFDDHGIPQYKIAANPVDGDGHFHTFELDGVPYGIYERTQEERDADYIEPDVQLSDRERIALLEEQLAAAKILLGVSE